MRDFARSGIRWMLPLLLFGSCVAGAADSTKVLRLALSAPETGFDPAKTSDTFSSGVIAAIMEPLLTFDYLARPVKIVPLTAEALPEITDSGRTYTFRIRPGIAFADDPAFKGKRRELTADDYVFAIKRLVDPSNRSPHAFHVAGKIVGVDEAAAAATKLNARFDYGTKIGGLEALDRYTLRIHLKRSDYAFANIFALPALSAVAREVVEAYPDDLEAHPVGTGPYVLKSWKPSSKITLTANPMFRDFVWNFAAGDDPRDKEIFAQMRGKRVPQIGRIEISVIESQQSSWLAFQRDELDVLALPAAYVPLALRGDRVALDLARKRIRLSRILDLGITYTAFNMRDPIVGGVSKENVALRRAIVMAYNYQEEIDVLAKGQAVRLHMPVPPGVAGHSATYRTSISHDPAVANMLLDQMGYRRSADGYRMLPNGSALLIRYSSPTEPTSRDYDELWKRAFDSIGIRVAIDKGKFSDQVKAAIACQHQMWSYGWLADFPDGDNFMQLLYGPNVGQSNIACYSSPIYDALYLEAQSMRDSPERTRLFERMTRQVEADTPWRLGVANYRNILVQPRVIGYKAHPVLTGEWMYVDIDSSRR